MLIWKPKITLQETKPICTKGRVHITHYMKTISGTLHALSSIHDWWYSCAIDDGAFPQFKCYWSVNLENEIYQENKCIICTSIKHHLHMQMYDLSVCDFAYDKLLAWECLKAIQECKFLCLIQFCKHAIICRIRSSVMLPVLDLPMHCCLDPAKLLQ